MASDEVCPCAHGALIRDVTPSSAETCSECVARGDGWVHLRVCLVCGHVGCCDESPNRHARRHFHTTGHPVIQSYEIGETWRYCFIDDVVLPDGQAFRPLSGIEH
ncbi:UBP-type zinc finger domain-containing protein [Devosia sp. A16]|uniref:UBP-type zinc finger domain-containing protein n=1 Tax=Devosia sp. A16 TaxID=1736675 RepID=UPI0006D82698|nr:UBP-type zinc finger domain-containing protein [Devosia sp. A16]